MNEDRSKWKPVERPTIGWLRKNWSTTLMDKWKIEYWNWKVGVIRRSGAWDARSGRPVITLGVTTLYENDNYVENYHSKFRFFIFRQYII